MPSTCDGCCDENGVCQPGYSVEACGVLGTTCMICDLGQTCVEGACRGGVVSFPDASSPDDGGTTDAGQEDCSPANCPSGCCQNNICQPGNDSQACGSGGAVCMACPSGQICSNGACTDSCTGCRDAAGTCLPGTALNACGANDAVCVACFADQICENGRCKNTTCNASNCNGCCDGIECILNTTETQCGFGGQACVACSPGQTCAAGQCTGTGPDGGIPLPGDAGFAFPDAGFDCLFNGIGCFDITTFTCAPGNQPNACGTGGDICAFCFPILEKCDQTTFTCVPAF